MQLLEDNLLSGFGYKIVLAPLKGPVETTGWCINAQQYWVAYPKLEGNHHMITAVQDQYL